MEKIKEEKSMNVLISSLSKKVPLIKTVKNALKAFGENSRLFGGDSDKNCIGRYFTDEFWHMPKLDVLTKEDVLAYAKKNKISCIIPTRNGELLFWSKIKTFLLKEDIHVMVSSRSALKICLDKQLFFEFLSEHHFPAIVTSSNILDIEANRFVVKEKEGTGSCDIGLDLTKNKAIEHAKALKDPIFQPFVTGQEYTVDLYIDKQGVVQGCIARKRLLIASGESQITETEKNRPLEELCAKIALAIGLKGHLVFQAIENKSKKSYSIVECNPRFGGASTLSVEAGLNSFSWFFLEALNKSLPPFKRIKDEIKMVRHAEDLYFHL